MWAPEVRQRPVLHLVGVACKLPAGADGVQGFVSVVSGSQDVQRVVPPERWDIDSVYAPEAAAGAMPVTTRCCHDACLGCSEVCREMLRYQSQLCPRQPGMGSGCLCITTQPCTCSCIFGHLYVRLLSHCSRTLTFAAA